MLIVTSTYGEGEMPDNAELFWEALSAESAPRLEGMDFAVLALGDTGYDGFCQAGKLIDMRLEQLGAQRIVPRVDCDVDYEDVAAAWIAATVGTIGLFLAALGLYGITAFSVSQRTREIAIRLAVGATHRNVLWLVLRQAGVLALAGAVAGLTLAAVLSRLLETLLVGLQPIDPA